MQRHGPSLPDVRTVIDIGGQDSKVIAVSKNGKAVDFAMNDKCAAGTGRFLEVTARACSSISLTSAKFLPAPERRAYLQHLHRVAESGHHFGSRRRERGDIVAGLHRAIAKRVAMVRRWGQPDHCLRRRRRQELWRQTRLGGARRHPGDPAGTADRRRVGAALLARDRKG
jgi:hypothetical protein